MIVSKFVGQIDFSNLILMCAQRKSYGATPRQHDLYVDETADALWTWELTQPSLYLEPLSFVKDLNAHREAMMSHGTLI